jgi:hypothetical protein
MPTDCLEKFPRSDDQVTLAEAYRSMLRLLEYYHGLGSDYEVGAILSDLSPGVWADGSPGDSAAWALWLNSVDGNKQPGAGWA